LALQAIKKPLGRIVKRAQFIQTMQATAQVKFLTLRSVQWFALYLCETIANDYCAFEIIDAIQRVHFSTMCEILRFDDSFVAKHNQYLQVCFYTPLEDGGIGLCPLSELIYHLKSKAKETASKLATEIRYHATFSFTPSTSTAASLKFVWRHISSTKSNAKLDLNKAEHNSWLAAWPNNPLQTLSDSVFCFAVDYRLGFIRSEPHTCPLSPSEKISDECATFDHLQSCTTCASIFFQLRHEYVNNNLAKVFKRHSLPCILNPPNLPRPSHEKGGPDFLLFVGPTTYAGDVTVTKNKANTSFQTKKREYSAFEELTGYRCLPIALSSRGAVSSKTCVELSGIERAACAPGLVCDLVNAIQFSLVVGLFSALRFSVARGLACSHPCTAFSPSAPPPLSNQSSQTQTANSQTANLLGQQASTSSSAQSKRARSPEHRERQCSTDGV